MTSVALISRMPWGINAQSFVGLAVDNLLEFYGLLDWDVSRLNTLQDLVHMPSGENDGVIFVG